MGISTSAGGKTGENAGPPLTRPSSEADGHQPAASLENGSAALNQVGGKAPFPPSQSPLVTLLQKKREGALPSGAAYIDPSSTTDSDKILLEAMDYLEKESAGIKANLPTSANTGSLHKTLTASRIESASSPATASFPVSSRKLTFENANKMTGLQSTKIQPRKIEDYEPGHSSLALLEPSTNDAYNPPIVKPGQFSQYFESDTEVVYRIRKKTLAMSPSQSDNSVHDLYTMVQKGGQIPLEGLKYPTVETKRAFSVPASTVRHYQQQQQQPLSHTVSDGGIRVSTREQRDQQTAVRKMELNRIIAEERRKKLQEESRDMQSRRHSDFFMPSQKSPIPLDRYEENTNGRSSSVLPWKKNVISKVRGKARALYNFKAQNDRELSFRKGDVLYLSQQIDRNWFEGERHGLVGRFPVSYVEVIVSLDLANSRAVEDEGLARALYNFYAQSSVELSLKKGDLVKLVRRVDENWFEGLLGTQRGIFPVRYVETLIEPNMPYMTPMSSRTVTPMIGSPATLSPSSSIFSIGPAPTIPSAPISPVDSDVLDESKWNAQLWCASPNRWAANSQPAVTASRHLRGERDYRVPTPHGGLYYSSGGLDEPQLSAPVQPVRPLSRSNSVGQSGEVQLNGIGVDGGITASDGINRNSFAHSVKSLSSSYRFENGDDKAATWAPRPAAKDQPLQRRQTASKSLHLCYPLYRAQYKYIPRNSDELMLNIGDIIYVVEKCDDGWFVGFSERSKDIGTFPGNYVQRLW